MSKYKQIKLTDAHKLIKKAYLVGPEIDMNGPNADNNPNNHVVRVEPNKNAQTAKKLFRVTSFLDSDAHQHTKLVAKRLPSEDMYELKTMVKTAEEWTNDRLMYQRNNHWNIWAVINAGLPARIYDNDRKAYISDNEEQPYTTDPTEAKVYSSSAAVEIVQSSDLDSDLKVELAYNYRSSREINNMIKKLKRESKSIPEVNLFGEDQSSEYELAIEVLEHKLTPNKIKQYFPDGGNVAAKGLLAHKWLTGEDVQLLLIEA